jgi:hypothetical protein
MLLATLFATTNVDPVLLLSWILTALSVPIVWAVREVEVAFTLAALMLLVDVIGLALSMTSVLWALMLAYALLVAWDAKMLQLIRQLMG